MAQIEQLELDAHRGEITADVTRLVEKYRAIFEWDVPEVDEKAADRLILRAIRATLDDVEKKLAS